MDPLRYRLYSACQNLLFSEISMIFSNHERITQLIKATKEAWHLISDQVFMSLCDSVPHCVQAVHLADGWYTKF